MEWHLFNNKAIPQGDKDNFHKFLIGRDPLLQKGYLHLNTLCISVVLAALIAHELAGESSGPIW